MDKPNVYEFWAQDSKGETIADQKIVANDLREAVAMLLLGGLPEGADFLSIGTPMEN